MQIYHIVFSVIATALGAYAYGHVAYQIVCSKITTSFWGRLVWLGTNIVILLSLFGGNASLLTLIPMIVNVSFMVIMQVACAYKKLWSITKIDVVCLIIVALSLILYLFADQVWGLLLTILADCIGGFLIIMNMFKGGIENRRQFAITDVRNLLMLFANDNPPTFLSVAGLAYQTVAGTVLLICAHITKKRNILASNNQTV